MIVVACAFFVDILIVQKKSSRIRIDPKVPRGYDKGAITLFRKRGPQDVR
jgi:hypothetical protein